MYFVVKGSVTVFSKLGIPLTALNTGATFGEVSLLTRSRRNAFVRADTYVVLAILGKEHFDPIVERFPVEMAKMIAQVNKERRYSASTGSLSGLCNEKALARKFSLMCSSSATSGGAGNRHTISSPSVGSSRRSSVFCGDLVPPMACPVFSAGELRRASVMSTSSIEALDFRHGHSSTWDISKRRFTRDIGDPLQIPSRRMSDGTVTEGRRQSRLSQMTSMSRDGAPETTIEDDYRGIPMNMKPLVEAFRDLQIRFGHVQGLIENAVADGTISEEDFNINDEETIL